MASYKTISVSEETFKDFERMAESYGLSNKGLVEAMLTYFKVTKADPRSPQADNPTDAIKALDKRLVSFIKEQEKKLLIPIKEAVFEIASSENGVARRPDLRVVHRDVKKIIAGLKLPE